MRRGYSRRRFLEAATLAGAGLAVSPRGLPSMIARAAAPDTFEPSWESLARYPVPEWYQDAKFGIFLHWGVYSVPAFDNEWYPRNMYLRGSEVFGHHREHFGPQSTFGYKDFIPRFRAERWDPERWVELFRKAGAKYIVPVGEHHDGFPMYNCSYTDWCAAKMGPKRDVVGELARAARRQGLKLGVSSHRAFNWSYYTFEEDFDTSNPKYSGLYGIPHPPLLRCFPDPRDLRQKPSEAFVENWLKRALEIADRYRPDLMWFDFCFECPEFETSRKKFAAHYYNRAEEWQKGVVINYKHDAYPENVAVLDIERGLLDRIRPRLWQTDTSVSWKSWGYVQDDTFKTPGELIHELVDIVSKNGCLLLNVGPRPDGTIPEEAEKVFLAIGRWLEVNGEAVYGTRPWKVYGEGPTKLAGGQFGEKGEEKFTAQDFRFAAKKNAVYAICLGWPEKGFEIKSLGLKSGAAPGKVARVELLGSDEKLRWKQTEDALSIEQPAKKPCDDAWALRMTLEA
jgi:alpha-L-fucosidase